MNVVGLHAIRYINMYGASINAISLDVIGLKVTNCYVTSSCELVLNAIRLDMIN